MLAKWYLVKYAPDVFRDEPRNVGVIVIVDDHGFARFVGERNGKFDGRTVPGFVNSTETLRGWVRYLRKHIESGSLDEEVAALKLRSLDNYRIEPRGALLDVDSNSGLQDIVDSLYADFVADVRPPTQMSTEDLANRILHRDIVIPDWAKIEDRVKYLVSIKGERRPVYFDYRYLSERTVLLDRISLGGYERIASQKVNDLLFRIEHLSKSEKSIKDFVTLYSCEQDSLSSNADSEIVEQNLRLLEKYSDAVDIRRPDAAERVAELLGVSPAR